MSPREYSTMPETNVETLSKKTSEGRPYQREAMANNDTRDESGGFECFNCGYACKTGELSCPNCLTMFSTGGRTRKLADAVTYHQPDQKWPTGDVFLATQQILTFC